MSGAQSVEHSLIRGPDRQEIGGQGMLLPDLFQDIGPSPAFLCRALADLFEGFKFERLMGFPRRHVRGHLCAEPFRRVQPVHVGRCLTGDDLGGKIGKRRNRVGRHKKIESGVFVPSGMVRRPFRGRPRGVAQSRPLPFRRVALGRAPASRGRGETQRARHAPAPVGPGVPVPFALVPRGVAGAVAAGERAARGIPPCRPFNGPMPDSHAVAA